ncbi:DNA-binding response regulator [Actinocatenispora thailandica]|uniref:DNA-binding response regulator n=1 Tax=Actinocatenispora thailandica TaxID=227318 RepID=A0A7R7DJI3_9ACTN|nr:response regulator transcription factor [Actinocatenispora thailandica]BCJ32844.1 DNA-binding response regulator [Actinocatenispora thailandica]
MARVLLVEDDTTIRAALVRAMSSFGHHVTESADARGALAALGEHAPDVVVLDLGLPDLDGTAALRMIRARSTVPVLIATARDREADIVRLLNAGADDYLTKPYSAAHLVARISAVLRRAAPTVAGAIAVGGLRLDAAAREAALDGRPLSLARREFDLLAYLAARPGAVVSRRELLAEVWGQPDGGDDATIDVHISWLRRKLGETAAAPRYLHTVRGVGIKLVAPAAR